MSSQTKCKALALVAVVGLLACASAAAGPSLSQNPGLKDHRQAARLHAAMQKGASQAGIASWYGGKFHGRRTANGEVYNMNGLSAAHKTLPFGTVVRVHNLDNGRIIDVRINDRGPFIKKRILDLSKGAAKKIGLIGAGVANVELSLVSWAGTSTAPAASPQELSEKWVQAGAFRDLDRARKLVNQLKRKDRRFAVYSQNGWHRVRARVDSAKEAKKLLKKLRRADVEATVVNP